MYFTCPCTACACLPPCHRERDPRPFFRFSSNDGPVDCMCENQPGLSTNQSLGSIQRFLALFGAVLFFCRPTKRRCVPPVCAKRRGVRRANSCAAVPKERKNIQTPECASLPREYTCRRSKYKQNAQCTQVGPHAHAKKKKKDM